MFGDVRKMKYRPYSVAASDGVSRRRVHRKYSFAFLVYVPSVADLCLNIGMGASESPAAQRVIVGSSRGVFGAWYAVCNDDAFYLFLQKQKIRGCPDGQTCRKGF